MTTHVRVAGPPDARFVSAGGQAARLEVEPEGQAPRRKTPGRLRGDVGADAGDGHRHRRRSRPARRGRRRAAQARSDEDGAAGPRAPRRARSPRSAAASASSCSPACRSWSWNEAAAARHGGRGRPSRRPPERVHQPHSRGQGGTSSTPWPKPACPSSKSGRSSARSGCRAWPTPMPSSRRWPGGPGVRYAALVPNLIGVERAAAAGITDIALFGATSETFSRRNINQSIADSFATFGRVVPRAQALGMRVRGYLSTCFGCPYEGDVPPARVRELTRALLDLGVVEVAVSDTIGVATPGQVWRVLDALAPAVPVERGRAALPRHARARRSPTCSPGSRQAWPRSTRPAAAWAAARTRQARRATSPPKISSTCSTGSASRPA